MFLDDETAKSRIEGSRNILTRINRDDSLPESYPVVLPSAEDLPDRDSADLDSAARCILLDEPLENLEPELTEEQCRALVTAQPHNNPFLHHRPRRMNEAQQADCAVLGTVLGRQVAAEAFGKNTRHVNYLQTGVADHNTAAGDNFKPSLFARIEEEKANLRGKATDRLNHVLDLLTNEKLRAVEKARDLTQIAVQLSQVVEKTLPREMTRDDGVHFHVYRPEIRHEETYNVVEVG